MTEARISIDGAPLTEGQAMTLRVALTSFLSEVSDPEYAAKLGPIADLYRERSSEILERIFASVNPDGKTDTRWQVLG